MQRLLMVGIITSFGCEAHHERRVAQQSDAVVCDEMGIQNGSSRVLYRHDYSETSWLIIRETPVRASQSLRAWIDGDTLDSRSAYTMLEDDGLHAVAALTMEIVASDGSTTVIAAWLRRRMNETFDAGVYVLTTLVEAGEINVVMADALTLTVWTVANSGKARLVSVPFSTGDALLSPLTSQNVSADLSRNNDESLVLAASNFRGERAVFVRASERVEFTRMPG